MVGSELEFYLVRETYADAHAKGYEGLTPSVPYILDYHILASTYDEPLLRSIRNNMQAAGIRVETSKGEAWPGQQEINFRFADALTMADNHVIYKNGAKEIAFLHGCAISFMAKPFESWIGSSCHIHASLWRNGRNAFARGERATTLFRRFLAGQIACAKELAIFFAPTINSYKRYAAGSWAPTTLAWGHDNRTCGFRVVGHGQALRVETRIPGGDVNPYLAFAAIIASGLHGIENELRLPAALEGNAYESSVDRFPSTMRRRDRRAGGGHGRPRCLRRPGRRPLPQLRAHRAGAVRSVRHRLGTKALLRAHLSPSTARLRSARSTLRSRRRCSSHSRLSGRSCSVRSGSTCCAARATAAGCFYRERRISRGRAFDVLKLRTLRESVLGEAEGHVRPFEADAANLTWAGRRVLKPLYLDELPQLVNILRGEMSLVGPRPWPPELVERQLARGVDYRLRVTAGWTGPAQVSKGLEVEYENLDRAYVELLETRPVRAVLRYDLGILRRTLATMLRGEGLTY